MSMTQTDYANAKAWTKAAELAVLDETIERFRTAPSYLGPWLVSIRAEVERDLRCDVEPEYLPSEARREAQAILAEATRAAEAIVTAARRRASEVVEAGREAADREREACRRRLQAAQAAL